MTPQQKYQQDLLRPGFVADPAQGMAISRLERLYQDLLRRRLRPNLEGCWVGCKSPSRRSPSSVSICGAEWAEARPG